MCSKRAKLLVTGAATLGLAIGLAWGDVYYQVGPGQTYATIQAAINATPWKLTTQPQPTFTESHIINIHAGTYASFASDFSSRLNGQLSRTSVTNRLIIQAEPGDEVVITNSTVPASIRESHVTVRGIKFTGKSADALFYYMQIDTGGYGTPNRQRGGIIVQNCEFVGGRGLKSAVSPTSYNGLEPGVTFSHLFVNNYVRDFESHYETPGPCEKPIFYGGNLYTRWGKMGGASLFLPRSGTNIMGLAYQKRWYLNNTFHSWTNGNLSGAIRVAGTNVANVVFANNLLYWDSLVVNQYYEFCENKPDAGFWPVLAHNLRYAATPVHWGRSAGTAYSTLTLWSNYVTTWGGTLVDHLDDNPRFMDLASGDFRLDGRTKPKPAVNRADTSYWNDAMETMGIADLDLLDYWNPARDVGFHHEGASPHLGAMQAVMPPLGTMMVVR